MWASNVLSEQQLLAITKHCLKRQLSLKPHPDLRPLSASSVFRFLPGTRTAVQIRPSCYMVLYHPVVFFRGIIIAHYYIFMCFY